jgi:transposase
MGNSDRRRYTPEYRAAAVAMVTDTGRPIADVARQLGVSAQLLGSWISRDRKARGPGPADKPLDASERAELRRLRKEVAEARLDNEFLKKAAAFFAKEQFPNQKDSN